MDNNNFKKLHGQFYTTVNPFHNQLFLKWFNNIDGIKNQILLEPFAGSNNIVKMVSEFYNNEWACFDINPCNENNKFPKFQVIKNNSFANFPSGFKVAITNPPYLAKNSATKDGLDFPNTQFDDLYKLSLNVMLDNLDYVAAIIPASFTNQNLFHSRLYGISTLNCRMFEDTECPVCLALFVPENLKNEHGLSNEDFYCYKGNVNLGLFSSLSDKKQIILNNQINNDWRFNEPNGEIGLFAIDNTNTKSIRFVDGNDISSQKIKNTNRGVTRITGLPSGLSRQILIKEANLVLDEFRENTNDFFITAFRGLRKDGDFRRRLDFKFAKLILNHSLYRLGVNYA